MEQLLNLINGELRPALGGTTIDVYAPATGRVIAQAPDSDERDVQAAVDAATKAFPVWNGMGVEGRSNALLRLADAIEQDMDGFVADESRDNGKPLSLARRVDIPRAVAN